MMGRAGNPRGFRLRTASAAAARDFGPNMTPMVDIVMVILIFFMAGSSFIGPEWFLDVSMAKGPAPQDQARPDEAPRASLELPPTRTVIRLVTVDGATRVTGMGLQGGGIDELAEKLAALRDAGAGATLRVVIEPGVDTPYQDVIRVYDLCQRAGLTGVGLARARDAEQR